MIIVKKVCMLEVKGSIHTKFTNDLVNRLAHAGIELSSEDTASVKENENYIVGLYVKVMAEDTLIAITKIIEVMDSLVSDGLATWYKIIEWN